MEPEADPFSIFETKQDPQVNELGKPKKRVHLDPMIQLESALIANKLGSRDKN